LTYDFKIGCKPFSTLVELIEVHAILKELGEFEKKLTKNWKKNLQLKFCVTFSSFFTQVFYFNFSIIF
jgi:hypothetical protein